MPGQGEPHGDADTILYGPTPARTGTASKEALPKPEDLRRAVLTENTLDKWSIEEEEGVFTAYGETGVLTPFSSYDETLDHLLAHEVDMNIETIGDVLIQQQGYEDFYLETVDYHRQGEKTEESHGPFSSLQEAREAAEELALKRLSREMERADQGLARF